MEKIKLFFESEKGKDILTVVIVILVGFGAFMLGRLSKDAQNGGIHIQYEDLPAKALGSLENGPLEQFSASVRQKDLKKFFASSRGSKYYSFECSGGKTIKEENRIYFNTPEEAEKAGYKLSSSCR